MKLGIFRRGPKEEPLSELQRVGKILDRLCANHPYLREDFSSIPWDYGSLDKHYGPHSRAMQEAATFEEKGMTRQAREIYQMAGVFALHERLEDGIIGAFTKYAELGGVELSGILKNPKTASEIAKALYEEMKPKQAEARPEIKKPEIEATPQVGK
jgi:hypothetical protein